MGKRILVISNMYPTEENRTFGIFVKNQVKALEALGNQVDVIAITDPKNGKANVIKKYFLWFLQTLVNLGLNGKKYDVVHAHYVFPSGLLARFYKKVWKTPYVVTAHGGDIDRMAKKNQRIRNWTEMILRDADYVIAVGNALYEEIHQDYKIGANKLSILNMGVNRNVFKAYPKQEARTELGVSEGKQPILFVGNIIREKGLTELITAFAKVKESQPEAALYLIGASRNQTYRQELENLIAAKGLARDVCFKDPLPQAQLAKWMSAAEVFVLPSHLEGFGLVAVEAMSCLTPVVGSDVGGLSYLLKDGNGVLVEPKEADSLAKGILTVLSSEDAKKKLVRKGEAKAAENDEEQLILKLQDIYETIS
ncbi:glycosyltransferase [Cytobacillus sp. NCCP-133]|uniref:glycosyltransferase n=1 Tax=Cytobacillus sp. NCCP-133 TaxID=766848 RepID=UPI00222FAD42|nr:glycosyltransferase [Cytobacillus sp. NCCP-133]GLB60223.1 LPS biosynthesis protein RfbU [Cytobacillus sp. NCCP-133]